LEQSFASRMLLLKETTVYSPFGLGKRRYRVLLDGIVLTPFPCRLLPQVDNVKRMHSTMYKSAGIEQTNKHSNKSDTESETIAEVESDFRIGADPVEARGRDPFCGVFCGSGPTKISLK